MDNELELSLDVLDDISGESQEVRNSNPWLSYCEQLHRLREFGYLGRELDVLDEQLLSLEDMRKLCASMYMNLSHK